MTGLSLDSQSYQERLQYLEEIKKILPSLIGKAFRELLENKHLYQKLEIDVSELMIKASTLSKSTSSFDKSFADQCFEILNWRWYYASKTAEQRESPETHPFYLPTIKIYCSSCNRIEPFNACPPDQHALFNYMVDKRQQIFFIAYECQSCKGLPTIFMVRRNGIKLFLEGRSPIEHVEVSKFIPKEQRKYFSDAIIAHNSGQTLAGLFLLRTFIEQYLRSLSPNPNLPVDNLIEGYMEKLPLDFRTRFPSLNKIYSDLSVAIHGAEASVDLFDITIANSIKHFDAKRIFEINNIKLSTS